MSQTSQQRFDQTKKEEAKHSLHDFFLPIQYIDHFLRLTSMLPTPHIPLEIPSLYPKNRAGVIKVAEDWYNPNFVRLNKDAIHALPQGEVVPPAIGETSL